MPTRGAEIMIEAEARVARRVATSAKLNTADLKSETIRTLADELWSYKNNGESPATSKAPQQR